jgi:adenylate cyclase
MDYTMIGDDVNLAARVEGLTRKFASPVVITESTAAQVKKLIANGAGSGAGRVGHISLQKPAPVRVKGREKPVIVYAVEGLDHGEYARRVEDQQDTAVVEMTDK